MIRRCHRQLIRRLCSASTSTNPFAILQIEPNASKEDIKRAFRKLVKLNHPDLNKNIDPVSATINITLITEAYDKLMEDDCYTRWGDSSVAMACDIYTLQELHTTPLFDIYPFQILFNNNNNSNPISSTAVDVDADADTDADNTLNPTHSTLQKEFVLYCDALDSVSDMKRSIQSMKGQEWGLHGRRFDRDKLAKGWEVATLQDAHLSVLSYHLFLHSYHIQHGQILYAIVKK